MKNPAISDNSRRKEGKGRNVPQNSVKNGSNYEYSDDFHRDLFGNFVFSEADIAV